MRIVISDVHEYLKQVTNDNREYYIGMDVTDLTDFSSSAHGIGTSTFYCDGDHYSGVYVTCIDDEGYPII